MICKYFSRKKYLIVKLLEDWRIKIQQEKIALLKWPEDWRIGGFRNISGEKITLFKMTGGLEDSGVS